MQQQEKISKFLDAIHKEAQERRDKISHETETYKAEELKKAENEALLEAYTLIQHEAEEIKHRITRELSQKLMDGRRRLLLVREEIAKSVFEKAEQKLKDFTETAGYAEKLKSYLNVCKQSALYSDVTIYLRESDMKYENLVREVFGESAEVKADSSILIGGLKVLAKKQNMVYNFTLDNALDSQKDWFRSVCGLPVT